MIKNIIGFLIIFISIGAFALFVKPEFQSIQLSQETIKDLEILKERSVELGAMRENLLSEYQSVTEADQERLRAFLPESLDNVRVILETEGVAKRYGVTLQDISIDTPPVLSENEVDVSSVVMQMKLEGTYQDFITFLSEFERSLRHVIVKDVQFASIKPPVIFADLLAAEAIQEEPEIVPNRGEGEVYNYTVSVQTYWLPAAGV